MTKEQYLEEFIDELTHLGVTNRYIYVAEYEKKITEYTKNGKTVSEFITECGSPRNIARKLSRGEDVERKEAKSSNTEYVEAEVVDENVDYKTHNRNQRYEKPFYQKNEERSSANIVFIVIIALLSIGIIKNILGWIFRWPWGMHSMGHSFFGFNIFSGLGQFAILAIGVVIVLILLNENRRK